MEKLKKELEEHKQTVLSLISKLDEISEEMISINTEISSARNLLVGLQEELLSYKKVSIFVYQNGEIELEPDDTIPELDETLLQSLFQKSEVEDLSVRQIKQLTILIVLTNSLREEDKEFDITFESEELQEVFEKIK